MAEVLRHGVSGKQKTQRVLGKRGSSDRTPPVPFPPRSCSFFSLAHDDPSKAHVLELAEQGLPGVEQLLLQLAVAPLLPLPQSGHVRPCLRPA